MESNPASKSIVEELKAAGEELKKAERVRDQASETKKEDIIPGESGVVSLKAGGMKGSAASSASPVEGVKGWVALEDYQEAIANEKQRMRSALKTIEELGKKVRERLEAVEKMEGETEKINTALKELGQRIVLIKKENKTLLCQIKEKLGEEKL